MKKLIWLFSFSILFAASLAFAQVVNYDFDEVDVLYAAQFVATPTSSKERSWIAEIAGGPDQPITVLYGSVALKKNGEVQVGEHFIKLSGEGGSERFLLNSAAYEYFEGTNRPKTVRTFFWSAKKVIGTTVIKDPTPPVRAVLVEQRFDESGQPTTISLSFSGDGESALAAFWQGLSLDRSYVANMHSLRYTGAVEVSPL